MSSAASAAQIAANKANALKSTGPRTPEGKARVASNAPEAHRADAVKLRRSSIVRDQNDGHGLRSERNPLTLATDTTLPFEQSEFLTTLADFMAEFAPTGPLETRLVERLAQIDLRLNRAIRIETAQLELNANYVWQQLADTLPAEPRPRDTQILMLAFHRDPAALKLIGQYESRLGRDFARTLAQLRQAQSVKRTGRAPSCALNVTRTAPLVGVSQERAPLSAIMEDPMEEKRNQTQSVGRAVLQAEPMEAPAAEPCPARDQPVAKDATPSSSSSSEKACEQSQHGPDLIGSYFFSRCSSIFFSVSSCVRMRLPRLASSTT